MSDTLYLSLWYPNLRLASMPDKLAAVLGSFATHGGEAARVYAVTVWPVELERDPDLSARVGPRRARRGAALGRGRGHGTAPRGLRLRIPKLAGVSGSWKLESRFSFGKLSGQALDFPFASLRVRSG